MLAASTANALEQERFLREIRLQASLSHPNIATVHTAFWVNDDLALVCELLEGQSLQQLFAGQPLPQRRALEVVSQVLEALSYAHARGIIHRDISPANIFLMPGGTVKLIDFGLAKAATDLRLTQEGSPVGAVHYMSPEQIRSAQDIDARTDLYSCGAVLYEFVTGKKVFAGDDSFTVMKAHAEEAPPSPGEANPQISKALSAVVLRALAKKPSERFQSADAFLQAIKQIQQSEPVQAARRFNRPLLAAGLAALTLVVIYAGMVFVGIMRTRRPAAQPVAVTPISLSSSVSASKPVSASEHIDVPKRASVSRVLAKRAVATKLVEPAGPPSAPVTSAADEKPNPVVKLGGTLKRLIPFRKRGATMLDNDR